MVLTAPLRQNSPVTLGRTHSLRPPRTRSLPAPHLPSLPRMRRTPLRPGAIEQQTDRRPSRMAVLRLDDRRRGAPAHRARNRQHPSDPHPTKSTTQSDDPPHQSRARRPRATRWHRRSRRSRTSQLSQVREPVDRPCASETALSSTATAPSRHL